MAASRREKKAVEKPAEAVRFMPLDGSGWEDSGYLPPEGDHSWREMEALRIGAYDRIGHLPPKSNQSWREQEALRLAATREAVPTVSADDNADDTGNAEDDPIAELAAPEPVADPMLDLMSDRIAEPVDSKPEAYVPVREPVSEFQPARRGAGGVMLLLVAVVGLVTVALAVPDTLTLDFWRAQWAAVAGKPAATPERVASLPVPAPPVVRPPPVEPSPAPVGDPGLNTPPPVNSEPPASAEPPATSAEPTATAIPEATPSPRPDRRGDRATMVIGSDGSVKYEDVSTAVAKPGPARRAAVPDDRDAGGFYAMAPGPDGKLRRQFFPSGPLTGSPRPTRAPSRDETGGVYAMAPGPGGKLTYQYFPATPSR